MSVIIRISFYQNNEILKSVDISEEDRELESMLLNTGSITGVGIDYDIKGLLNEEEAEMIKFHEIHERFSETKIMSAKSLLKIFKKIHFRVIRKAARSFLNELSVINNYELEQEEKDKWRRNKFSDYIGLEYQAAKLIGVLETAILFEYDVKITSEFY